MGPAKTADDLLEVQCRSTWWRLTTLRSRRDDRAHQAIVVGGGEISDPIVHWEVMMEAFKANPAGSTRGPPRRGCYFSSPTR